MKIPRILFAVIPLVFLAAGLEQHHQAYGALKFGDPESKAQEFMLKARNEVFNRTHHYLCLADIRNHFVTNGGKRPSKFSALENTIFISAMADLEPGRNSWALRANNEAKTYAQLKQSWEVMQELGDCKFTRVGKPGALPSEADLRNSGVEDTVTDTWEMEGIRITLSTHFFPGQGNVGEMFLVAMTAREIAPTQ